MHLYIEKVIIINIIIHLLIVYSVIFLTNNKIKKVNIIISTIIGVINIFLYIYYPHLNINYILLFLISFIPFFKIKDTILYVMLNICLGGVTGLINLSLNYYYEVIFISSIIILFIIFIIKKEDKEYTKIIIKTNKEYVLNAFYDTGCIVNLGLTPIIILNNKFNLELEYFSTIEVNTIDGINKHKVYKANNVYLLQNKKKIEKHCLIILSEIDYEVIIGKNFIGGI